MLEFDAGVLGRELPVGFGVMGIAIRLPSGNLVDEDLLVRDAAVETLRRENGEFGLRHIEPTAVLWRVMPFEPLDETSCFVWRKSLVQRCGFMGVEIVLHQNNRNCSPSV
jgi:hypothetical protein